jgi:multidrug resistance efflux pump
VAIPVKPNVPVKANDVLFQIEPTPFQYVAGAKQQVEILKSNYE